MAFTYRTPHGLSFCDAFACQQTSDKFNGEENQNLKEIEPLLEIVFNTLIRVHNPQQNNLATLRTHAIYLFKIPVTSGRDELEKKKQQLEFDFAQHRC
jgi:hypothetical protein